MKNKVLPIIAFSSLFLASCGKQTIVDPSSTSKGTSEASTSQTMGTSESSQTTTEAKSNSSNATSQPPVSSVYIDPDIDIDTKDYGDFSITTDVVDGYNENDNVFTITKSGTYKLAGTLEEGRIYIDVPESDTEDIVLELDGVSIKSAVNSPIFCVSGESLKIKSKKNTENYIIDVRGAKMTDDDAQGNGAIYSKCDTSLTGSGTLNVSGTYNNGVHSTKDLKIKSTTLNSVAINNALKGNDSVTITSGTILAKSTGGDGIKTEDSDISSKGNQRGKVTITGGQVDIYSWADGIDASYDAIIENGTDEDSGETTVPVVNIYTNKYADMTESTKPTVSDNTMYIRTKTATYSASYKYALECRDSSGNTSWVDATYKTSYQSNGSRSTYYYYSVEYPANATSFKIYKFEANATESESNYIAAMSSFATKNASYNTLTFTETGNTITEGSWGDYDSLTSATPGGKDGGNWGGNWSDGNTDKATDSAKGIKANNTIYINGGQTYVKAYDDGLHANYYQDSTLLENGEKGAGDVIINGGNLNVYASDDGIHADRYLNVNGGNITVENSYEGMEGSVINIAGGTSKVYATDDGLNAANKSNLTACINITGGYIDVAVTPNGDTDGIDSNGNYTQTGGVVVTKGPNSSMMAALDWGENCSASISGGTLLVFGGIGGNISTSGSVKATTTSVSRSGKVNFTVGEDSYVADCYSYTYSTQRLYTDSTVTIG